MSADGERGEHTSRDELRVRLYEILQRRTEVEQRSRLHRLVVGHAVIGAIVAYALMTGTLGYIALTPILYGIVVLDALRASVDLLYLHRHMVRLESALGDREPLFRWVTDYGLLGDGQAIEVHEVDLNAIPTIALYALIGSVYVVLIVVSLQTWPGGASTPGAIPVTLGLLAVGYAAFTLLFVAILGVGYLHYTRLKRDVKTERRS